MNMHKSIFRKLQSSKTLRHGTKFTPKKASFLGNTHECSLGASFSVTSSTGHSVCM
jgi:hypothetical protein